MSLITYIIEFLATVADAAKARQQSKAADEVARGAVEIKGIDDNVTAIRDEMAKLAEPPITPKPSPKPVPNGR